MAKNLLPKTISTDEINQHLHDDPNFRYSIVEGGYVSFDGEVIMITDRRPYVGMCLAHQQPTDSKQKWWLDYLCLIFDLKAGDGNG